MSKKAIIAVYGSGGQGKSATVRNTANLLITQFPASSGNAVPDISGATGDISTIITLQCYQGPIKIGIESQGDPNTNIYKRLEKLAQQNCDIILCTSRTGGATVHSIGHIASAYNYEVIWTANYTSEKFRHTQLNQVFAEGLVSLIKEIIDGRIYSVP